MNSREDMRYSGDRMKNKNLGINSLLNVIKATLSIIFPLITYPYAIRVLGTEGVGKVSYANSIVSYFALVAMLGMVTYGIREGAKVRNSTNKLQKLTNELFSINLLSTVVAYTGFIICLIFVPQFVAYRIVLLISSLTIIFQVIGFEWINIAFEDYLIITVRSIVSNIVCLFLLLILVRDREDYNIYAFISSLPIIINSIWNFFYIRKYVHPRFTVNLNLKTHLKPLTIIFFNTITALIYVNADITMLGWIKGDSVVGEYTIAVKVYTVKKNILVAIYAAVTPRLATMMSETAESQYKKLNTTIWCYLSLILIPAGFGLTAVSKDVMLLVGGEEIATTSFSLQILSISLIFAIYGGLITSVYNITQGREKENLMATTVSAIINCGLNLYMIPKYSLYGAAFTTLLSELFVFVFCTLRAPNKKRFFDVDEIKNSILYAVVGSILVLLTTKVVYMLVECSALLRLIIAVALSAVVYITYLIIFKNKYTIDIVRNIMVKIKKKY